MFSIDIGGIGDEMIIHRDETISVLKNNHYIIQFETRTVHMKEILKLPIGFNDNYYIANICAKALNNHYKGKRKVIFITQWLGRDENIGDYDENIYPQKYHRKHKHIKQFRQHS